MIDLQWAHVMFAGIGAIFGAAAGIFGAGYRFGKIERGIDLKIARAKDEVEGKLLETENRIDAKVGEFTANARDTLLALREKINSVELNTEKEFVSKDGFDEFRREYREDMKSLMAKVDQAFAGRHS